MHVFMGIGVVQMEAGCGEGGELGANFGCQFPAGGAGEEILKAERGLVAAEFAVRRGDIGEFGVAEQGIAIDQDEMQSGFEIWQTTGAGDCIFCFRRCDH